mgnify:FL=1
MTYPTSSEVAGGQPTLAAHYNNLRKDALYLGNLSTESIPFGSFLAGVVTGMKLEYLATNRVKVPHVAAAPARLMIDGYMLQSYADVELPAGEFAGAAATWYIFAVRASNSTFTLSVSTSSAVVPGTRLIGQCYWDGTNVTAGSVFSYFQHEMPAADYDSGYFAVTYNTTYAKVHNLKTLPAVVVLLHNTSATGAAVNSVVCNVGPTTGLRVPYYYDATTITCETGNDAANGTLLGRPANSGGGYYRILAWRSA